MAREIRWTPICAPMTHTWSHLFSPLKRWWRLQRPKDRLEPESADEGWLCTEASAGRNNRGRQAACRGTACLSVRPGTCFNVSGLPHLRRVQAVHGRCICRGPSCAGQKLRPERPCKNRGYHDAPLTTPASHQLSPKPSPQASSQASHRHPDSMA